MSTKNQELKKQLALKSDQLKRTFYQDMLSTTDVKLKTLQGDTARAMHRGMCYNIYKPSSIFKNWVHNEFFESKDFQDMLLNEKNFEKLHSSTLNSLRSHWFTVEPDVEDSMPDYLFYKMIDLLFKSISRWEKLENNRRDWYFLNVNVPLDKYSLKCLSKYHDSFTVKNPRMGFIKNAEMYDDVQRMIKELIAPHPPLLFDLFAWDHERVKDNANKVSFALVKAKTK